MRSIKTSLISSFLTVIAILFLSDIFIFTMHFIVVGKYKDITDNMILEYRLIGVSSDLIASYNGLIKDVNNKGMMNNFNNIHNEIKGIYAKLDKTIVNKDSQTSYLGLKSTINKVTNECDTGVKVASQGNFSEISAHYDEANRLNYFVRENTANLILNELEYTKQLQKQITTTQLLGEIISVILLLITSAGCIYYSFTFSQKLVLPLTNLTKLAEMIAKGDIDVTVDKNLLEEKNEVGSMAVSFNTMIFNLRDNISKLRKSNAQLDEAKKGVDSKNQELESMNKLMIGRELKMAEMKKEIEEFKSKSNA